MKLSILKKCACLSSVCLLQKKMSAQVLCPFLNKKNFLKLICISSFGLPRWLSFKETACQAGDAGSIPELGRCSGEENSYPLQYSCLGNPMDRRAWQTTVHGVPRVGRDFETKQQEQVSLYIETLGINPLPSI